MFLVKLQHRYNLFVVDHYNNDSNRFNTSLSSTQNYIFVSARKQIQKTYLPSYVGIKQRYAITLKSTSTMLKTWFQDKVTPTTTLVCFLFFFQNKICLEQTILYLSCIHGKGIYTLIYNTAPFMKLYADQNIVCRK